MYAHDVCMHVYVYVCMYVCVYMCNVMWCDVVRCGCKFMYLGVACM